MKNRKLIMFLHFIVLLAVLIGLIALFSRLRADWIFDNRTQGGGLLPLLLMLAATLPVSVCGQMAFGLLTGYKLKELSLPFVTFRPGQGVRFSGRIRIVLTMTPPEISSNIPFRLMTVGAPLTLLILSALLTPLALLLQTSPLSPWLLDAAQMCAIMMCIQLLPRKSQTDDLTLLFLMSRYPQMRLACAQNMAITAEPGAAFDKPDAWFAPYEMPLLTHPYPMSITIVYIARCIRQSRFAEAYPAVQAVLAIPDPATPFIIPCMLCQGALCEVLGDFPADCVNRLEEDSVQYLLPDNWRNRLLLARYARERCITRNDENAQAILQEYLALHRADDDSRHAAAEARLLQLIDEKAGVPAAKEPDDAP